MSVLISVLEGCPHRFDMLTLGLHAVVHMLSVAEQNAGDGLPPMGWLGIGVSSIGIAGSSSSQEVLGTCVASICNFLPQRPQIV